MRDLSTSERPLDEQEISRLRYLSIEISIDRQIFFGHQPMRDPLLWSLTLELLSLKRELISIIFSAKKPSLARDEHNNQPEIFHGCRLLSQYFIWRKTRDNRRDHRDEGETKCSSRGYWVKCRNCRSEGCCRRSSKADSAMAPRLSTTARSKTT